VNRNASTSRGRLGDESIFRFALLCDVRADVLDQRLISLLNSLCRTRSLLATDPGDKVFTLLGLTFDRNHLVSELGYMDLVLQSFTELATALIQGTLGGQILRLSKETELQFSSAAAGQ
jgi:hypothetical protein